MEKTDILEFIRLCNLKSFDPVDKRSAHILIQKYIDSGAKYCLTCDGSVRAMFSRLREWWLANMNLVKPSRQS